MLTPKQERFCQEIVSGKDGIESYMSAYDCQSKASASVESSKLLRRDDITERITELRKPLINLAQNEAINEFEKLKRLAWKQIDECQAKEDNAAIPRYMDIIAKLNGYYININRNIEDSASNIKELDNDALIKLANAN